MDPRSKSRNALEGSLSFEDCLGPDPIKYVHSKK